jgi:ribose transport system ATP-binding protein
MSSGSMLLEVRGVSKSYPGVRALDNVDFKVQAGEVHCLAGENGAGKSTLIEIIGGSYPKDSGSIFLEGKEVAFTSPKHAQECGIAVLHQELPILKDLSVAENIFLGRQPRRKFGMVDYGEMFRQARKWLDIIRADIDPRAILGRLPISKQQLVSIAKAISLEAKVIIMDEPSAVLTTAELERLFEIIAGFKAEGRGIVYISHRLEEIFEIGNRVTVLRNGKFVGSEPIGKLTRESLVQMLVGHHVSEEYIEHGAVDRSSPSSFVVRGFERSGVIHDINFEVSKGEIFGIYGLVGSGRTEVARAIMGADRVDSGELLLDGRKLSIKSPSDAIRNGICLVPEDRKSQGVLLESSIEDNIALPSLPRMKSLFLVNYRKIARYAAEYMGKLRIAAPNSSQSVKFLSGGNQQKVVLAKWIGMSLRVFIFDEPTRGIDIGAKEEIRALIRNLVKEGKIIILISSEIPEILSIADRIGVMHDGMMIAVMDRKEATKEKLVSYSMGSTGI